ncbi:sensor histidine kinase [Rugosibacter aromaticivorans]|uniref:sensor histidine kinase n=1 Tax=Rugosibacter aromaticivorans TaxID=1565605 RepID=UPI0039C856F3
MIKHAQATHITLGLYPDAGRVIFTITDNGIGFETGARHATQGGVGLTTMQERAIAIRATLTIRSSPGDGTQVTVVVSEHAIVQPFSWRAECRNENNGTSGRRPYVYARGFDASARNQRPNKSDRYCKSSA